MLAFPVEVPINLGFSPQLNHRFLQSLQALNYLLSSLVCRGQWVPVFLRDRLPDLWACSMTWSTLLHQKTSLERVCNKPLTWKETSVSIREGIKLIQVPFWFLPQACMALKCTYCISNREITCSFRTLHCLDNVQ